MAPSKLDVLVRTRQYARQRATKLCDKINLELPNLSLEQKDAYVNRLSSINSDITNSNNSILALAIETDLDDSRIEDLTSLNEDYEDKVALTMSLLRSETQVPDPAAGSQVPRSPKLKLPQVSFPEFSNGKGENLQKFFNSFEAIIGKHNLSSYEQFVYLRKQLTGAPRVLVDSLDVSQQSYETAKDLLLKAFHSDLNSKHDIIRELTKLNLKENEEPYAFLGAMRTVLAGVNSLSITINDVLQYFVWNGLNNDFKSHLVSITNKCKPSIQEINDNIFEASERYVGQIEQKRANSGKDAGKPPRQREAPVAYATAMAADVRVNKTLCNLCTNDKKRADHSMPTCPTYDSPKKKINKLKLMNACTRCSFFNHTTNNCKFKFKSPCRHCNGNHMSYLCMKMSNNNCSGTSQPGKRPVVETLTGT
jgi:hypothetical protein